jgi:hypothetical protein
MKSWQMRLCTMQQRLIAARSWNCAFAHFNNSSHAYADNCRISAQLVWCRMSPMLKKSSAYALEMIERLVKE